MRGRRGEFGASPWSWGGGCGIVSSLERGGAGLAGRGLLTWVPPSCLGNYRTQLYDKQREEYQPATPGLGMFVEVKDPEDKVSRTLPSPSPPLAEPSARQALVLPLLVSASVGESDGVVGRFRISAVGRT